jgi:hypothetical protein
MMVHRTVYTEVEVDVDMSDFSDEDILEEVEIRGLNIDGTNNDELINKIFQLRRLGKPFEQELDEYLYLKTGRII